MNFTFEGHTDARQRGLRVLTAEELRHGDVSFAYVSRLMHRKYPDPPLFRKVLQTIWHQVNNGQEIFAVGKINADDTVTGGTGVAAESAKFFNKPLWVLLDARLADGRPFLACDAVTVADFPHVGRWDAAYRARPAAAGVLVL